MTARMQLIRFATVGVANTLFGLALIFAAKWFLELGDVAANAIGYLFGIGLGFALNRTWTFNDDSAVGETLLRYLIVVGAGYVINLAVVMSLIGWAGFDSYLAQALGIPPYVLFVFVGSRQFVFGAASKSIRSRMLEL